MATTLENYFEDTMLSVNNRSIATDISPDEVFFDDSMKVLIEDGHSVEIDPEQRGVDIGGYQYTPYKGRGLRIDGYEFLPDRDLLNLYVCHFNADTDIYSLTKTELNQLFSNTKRFYEKSLDEDFSKDFAYEGEDAAYEVSDFIYRYEERIKQIRVIFITNAQLSKSIDSLRIGEEEWIDSKETIIDVWDIKRFYDNEMSQGDTEAVVIDFNLEFNAPLPALSAHIDTSDYQSYLCVIPGKVLASLYKKYGARLLESNVRSFLQFKGKVNQQMRNTIINDPDLFFAYNNGITATADSCVLDEDGNISKLTNLQIVNGGQTTASLSRVYSDGKSDLDGVFVQMKLSEIKHSDENENLVSNISRYANSQNKISESDFFSNHPFHRTFEGKSRRIFTPKRDGEVRETKWFYERSRGQYQNELNNRSGQDRRVFLEQYPKSQLITKTDLAKVSIIFDGGPNHAVKGAQAAFKKFANEIQRVWEKNTDQINDHFYKKQISQQIMYNHTRALVMKEVTGNAIQPITAYALHMINRLSASTTHSLNYQLIWDKGIYSSLENQIVSIIETTVKFFDLNIEGVEGRTVLSYSKTNECIKLFDDMIDALDVSDYLNNDYYDSLRSIEELAADNAQAVNDQSVEDESTIIVKLSRLKWDKVIAFAKESPDTSDENVSLLSIFPAYYKVGRLPTTKQIFAINNILMKLKDEGLDI